MSLLQSASSGLMITFNTPERQEGDEGREKKQGGKGDKKQPGLPADIYILQMYPESSGNILTIRLYAPHKCLQETEGLTGRMKGT